MLTCDSSCYNGMTGKISSFDSHEVISLKTSEMTIMVYHSICFPGKVRKKCVQKILFS